MQSSTRNPSKCLPIWAAFAVAAPLLGDSLLRGTMFMLESLAECFVPAVLMAEVVWIILYITEDTEQR